MAQENNNQQELEFQKKLIQLSQERSEMAAGRSYMNAERTLSVWIRTALALMVFGIAIDRFALLIQTSSHQSQLLFAQQNMKTSWGGVLLVLFGTVMVILTGIRFILYARSYRKQHAMPAHDHAVLAPAFAILTAIFGVFLLVIMLAMD